MDAQLTIRNTTIDDIGTIHELATHIWRATYSGSIPDDDIDAFLASAYSSRSLSGAVNRLGDGFVVVERAGQVIGYAMAGLNRESEPELYAIYVEPAYHGIGAGLLLWNAARAALARQGHPRMCCWVLATNERARRFYERQGAILTEEREFQIGATAVPEARYCVSTHG